MPFLYIQVFFSGLFYAELPILTQVIRKVRTMLDVEMILLVLVLLGVVLALLHYLERL